MSQTDLPKAIIFDVIGTLIVEKNPITEDEGYVPRSNTLIATLQRLKAKHPDLKIFAVSTLIMELAECGFPKDLFTELIEDGNKLAILINILRENDLQPAEVVYVADGCRDKRAARSCKVPFIEVANSPESPGEQKIIEVELAKHFGADILVSSKKKQPLPSAPPKRFRRARVSDTQLRQIKIKPRRKPSC